MLNSIIGYNAPLAYEESLWLMRTRSDRDESRNGPVRTIQSPVMLEITRPDQRLITDPTRDANPFFHAMEFIWMMAGSSDVRWLAQFNSGYMQYSDDGFTVNGAYGMRWRNTFGVDQILVASEMLIKNPSDRRVVLQMWSTARDLGSTSKDIPCNTQIMLRAVNGALDMLVTNRSNDLIWGMLGANVVHMTMLHELLAQSAGLALGKYRVVTNNLHMYELMPRFKEIIDSVPVDDIYRAGAQTMPLLRKDESIADFLDDCEALLDEHLPPDYKFQTQWMINVGVPMYKIYLDRKAGLAYSVESIAADDWRIACSKWLSHPSRGLSPPSESSKSTLPGTNIEKRGW